MYMFLPAVTVPDMLAITMVPLYTSTVCNFACEAIFKWSFATLASANCVCVATTHMQEVESPNASYSHFFVEVLSSGKIVFSKEDYLLLVRDQTEFTVAFNITDTNIREEVEEWAV